MSSPGRHQPGCSAVNSWYTIRQYSLIKDQLYVATTGVQMTKSLSQKQYVSLSGQISSWRILQLFNELPRSSEIARPDSPKHGMSVTASARGGTRILFLWGFSVVPGLLHSVRSCFHIVFFWFPD